MCEKLDSDCLPRISSHIQRLLDPSLVVGALVENGLQNRTRGIGDVSVLPVETDAIDGARPVPETQYTSTVWHCNLLIKGAVSWRLASRQATDVTRKGAAMNGKAAAGTSHEGSGLGGINYPAGTEAAALKAAVIKNVTNHV
jgi:hypothetical protein